MAGAFLQRRASGAKAEQWRAAAARVLRAVGGEEKRNGTASAFGRRAGWLQTRLRRQEAHGAWPARAGVRRRVADTRRRFSET